MARPDPVCPYCGANAVLVTGKKIYPHRPDLAKKQFWECEPCDAYVGVHPNTIKPMGRLANLPLRQAKMWAHAHFDPLWKDLGMTRQGAYKWLAYLMGIPEADCHIGMFNEEQCAEVVRLVCDRKDTI